jgi:hypothetical protein
MEPDRSHRVGSRALCAIQIEWSEEDLKALNLRAAGRSVIHSKDNNYWPFRNVVQAEGLKKTIPRSCRDRSIKLISLWLFDLQRWHESGFRKPEEERLCLVSAKN